MNRGRNMIILPIIIEEEIDYNVCDKYVLMKSIIYYNRFCKIELKDVIEKYVKNKNKNNNIIESPLR